ncbi:MAG: hypothetical protein ACYCVA_04625, partial [Sulfobacillus sp.]
RRDQGEMEERRSGNHGGQDWNVSEGHCDRGHDNGSVSRLISFALQAWVTAMQAAKQYVTPNPIPSTTSATTASSSPQYNTHWAGYWVASSNNGGIVVTQTSASWQEPYYPYSNNQGVPAFWTGIGGVTSSSLVQAGASSEFQVLHPGYPQYSFWVEDYPYNTKSIPVTKVPISAYDQLYVSVTYNGATSSAFLENETTGKYTTVNFNTPDYSGTSADYINEAVDPPTFGYPDWGQTTFSGCQLSTSNGSGGLFWTYATTEVFMTNTGTSSGTPEATPGPIIEGNTNGFTITSTSTFNK